MLQFDQATAAFSGDQQIGVEVAYYDTPFLVLEGTGNRAASPGVEFHVVEPAPGEVWTLAADLEAAASPNAAQTEFESWTSVISGGRTGNLIGYWAGGAPGEHGVTQVGRVAYRFNGVVRPGANRAWFASGDAVPVTFAFGGNGYFRIDHNNSTNLVSRVYTEADFLATGLGVSAPVTINSGDTLEFYYAQRAEDKWGGFVFKAAFGDLSTLSEPQRNVVLRDAPVIGCGFFDQGSVVTKRVIQAFTEGGITNDDDRVREASVEVPLVNPAQNDLVGYEYVRDLLDPEDPGSLTWLAAGIGADQFDIFSDRLVRITATINNESWPMFTGYIGEIRPGEQPGRARLALVDPSQLLIPSFDRNRPDRIDYMTFNYRRRRAGAEPVYDIPAFDNWPLEYAIRVLMVRGGIDASLLEQQFELPWANVGDPQIAGRIVQKFEARTMDQTPKMIRLSRAIHYGNYGQAFTEAQVPDDEYLFAPVNTRNVWGRAQEICDKYGYKLGFDEYGHAMLKKLNTPQLALDFDETDGTNSTNGASPEAHAGTYVQTTNAGLVTKAIRGARIDVAVGRFPGAGSWSYQVERASAPGVPIASGSFATSSARTEFFYDYEAAVDGINSTVLTLWTGELDDYVVKLTASGTCRLDCLLAYLVDPETSLLPGTLSSAQNARLVLPQQAGDQMRNHVIVVGRRKATVTDSEKLRSTAENPESEFVVARAVDVRSITDPTALHYVGKIKETIIYSDDIADDDFAQYIARTFIYRYRNPYPGAQVRDHSLLPFIQLWDPVEVQDSVYETVEDTKIQWVTRIQHSFRPNSWTTNLDTTAFPPFPSFEPRADIDIDLVFAGVPAIDVEINYKSISGHDTTNLTAGAPLLANGDLWPNGDKVESTLTITGGALDLAAASLPMPVPSSIQVMPANVPDSASLLISQNDVIVGAIFRPGTTRVAPDIRLLNLLRPSSVIVTARLSIKSPILPGSGLLISVGTFTLTQNPDDNPYKFSFQLRGNQQSPELEIRRSPSSPLTVTLPDGSIIKNLDDIVCSVNVSYRTGVKSSAAQWYANTPYHTFTEPDYAAEEILLPWEHGDLAQAAYDLNSNVTQMNVRYRTFPGMQTFLSSGDFYTGGVSPFYDPYTSELGHLIKIKFDLLVTGRVRVSVRNRNNPNIAAAWLTEPANESADSEDHWQYMTAGSNKVMFWDGVDAVGEWNFTQSEDYANAALGAFEQDDKPKIGKGFYVWNRERDGGNLGPLALIEDPFVFMSGDLSRHDLAEHAIGTFASWFVLIEAVNDDLEAIAQEGGPAIPRKLDSRVLLAAHQSNGQGSIDQAVIHTHLPAPSRLELDVSDWGGVDFDETSTGSDGPDSLSNWYATPILAGDTNATINNQRPVRIRFTAVDRLGVLWNGNQLEQSMKLFRMAHLKALIHDQFVIFDGVTFAGSNVESKQVVSRRLYNDTHTVKFEDVGWRRAKTFKPDPNGEGLEWIFLPRHFKRPFTGALDLESIQFGDYLQLEEVPKWDPVATVGGPRSRLQIAFMAYLFYLSVYTQDRSGRFSWAIDPTFVDQSKIIGNTRPTSWPADLLRQHRRTIITRQWMNEKSDGVNLWKTRETQKWNLTGIGAQLLEHKWYDHDPSSSTINGVAWTSFGLATDLYTNYHRTNNQLQALGLDLTKVQRQLPSSLGDWDFETFPTWVPCVFRDWWPYHMIPPMADYYYAGRTFGLSLPLEARQQNIYGSPDDSPFNVDENTGNDPAKGDIWSSGTWDHTEVTNTKFDPGTVIAYSALPIGDRNSPGTIAANNINYTRQDDTQHWEEYRGIWSRGPRPTEPPRKISPILPYYVNQYQWQGMLTLGARRNSDSPAGALYPKYVAKPGNHFSLSFRSTYNWESATLFPADLFGVEMLNFANLERAQLEVGSANQATLRYDAGGWVGWKDDGAATISWDLRTDSYHQLGVFDSGHMRIAIGPTLPETIQIYMHMVLVNERRLAVLTPNSYSTPTNVPDTISLIPSVVSGNVGDTVGVQVRVLDAGGDPVQLQGLTVSSSNPKVARVFSMWPYTKDVVIGLNRVGSAVITFTVRNVSQTLNVTVS